MFIYISSFLKLHGWTKTYSTVQNSFTVHVDESVCFHPVFILFYFEMGGKTDTWDISIEQERIDASFYSHNVHKDTEYFKSFYQQT